MFKRFIVHPIIFSTYPILALLAANLGEVNTFNVGRSIIISILFTAIFWGVLRLIFKDWSRSGLFTTLILLLFFSYGHIYDLLSGVIVGGIDIGRSKYLIPLWGLLLIASFWWIWRKNQNVTETNSIFNWVGIGLLLFPLYSIISFSITTRSLLSPIDNNSSSTLDSPENTQTDDLPDIYYIVLDGYGRTDVLSKLYDYDNRALLSFMESRGFYSAESSYANYNLTRKSLAASMSMEYLDLIADELGPEALNNQPLEDLVHFGKVRQTLSKNGYQTVSFESGIAFTQLEDADYYLGLEGGPDLGSVDKPQTESVPIVSANNDVLIFNRFESLLLDTTLFRVFINTKIFFQQTIKEIVIDKQHEIHRQRILNIFTHLADFAGKEGNYFIFAHIIAPHPPFVFDSDGEPTLQTRVFSFEDGDHFTGSQEEYISGYREQIQYIDRMVMDTLDQILDQSEKPPIIILQGDHGPGAYLFWNSPEETNMNERLAILNAYYFPDGDYQALYPAISPVNSFRIVFNQFFGANYDLLPDRSFISVPKGSYNFIEVTDQLE